MIYEKLIKVQAALKAPKNQYNSFGKYNYRNCDDILEAVKPSLQWHGLCLTISDSIEQVGNRIYIKSTGKLIDIEDKDNIITVSAFARESENKKGMDEAQITGAASSYARKYMLNGLFAIDDSKDADSQKPPAPQPTQTELENVKAMVSKTKSVDDLNKVYKQHIKPRFTGEQLKELEALCKSHKDSLSLEGAV